MGQDRGSAEAQLPRAAGGTYVLLLEVPRALTIPVGRLGPVEFAAGRYAYVGSALGGLAGRLGRHLRREKRRHWHIDYLLERAGVVGVIVAQTGERLECEVARALGERYEVVPRFGASDCRCPGHLFRGDDGLKAAVESIMRGLGMEPGLWARQLPGRVSA